jgi:ABC-type proline/glycine betaine transport system permease subunit
VLLLALAFTAGTLVEHWQPSPLGVRLVAGARTLAVASGLVAAGAGVMGGGGVGWFLLEGARLQQYGPISQAVLVVLVLALALDLLLGVVQMAAHRWMGV